MILVKNKLRQPLVVNVREGKAIHFLSKQSLELTPEQFNSPEMKNHIERENLVVLRME